MVSPVALQRSPIASPLHCLSTFKTPTASFTAAPSSTFAPPPPASILDSFAKDPILSPFLSPSFSSASFSSTALSSRSPASTVEHLLQAICQLDSQIRSHVLSDHPLLPTQLSSLNNTEISLSTLRFSISSLNPIIQFSPKLSNSPIPMAIRLSKKLRDPMAFTEAEPDKLDLVKAAQLHEIVAVKEIWSKLRSEAMKVLEKGTEGLNGQNYVKKKT